MQRLIALRAMRYGTRRLAAADDFYASPKDARILKAIGRAKDYVEPVKPRRRKAEPVVEQAVEPVVEQVEHDDEAV